MFDLACTPDADAGIATTPDDPWGVLNPGQRRAVMHGDGASPAPPLLIIAGAGSGKTNTLAHRVARLVHDGADPARILLLTFSRRAAQELERRAAHVLQKTRRLRGTQAPALPWAGTFHAVGARLLREYAQRIGLAPNFTIHDRADAEDLMGLVRQARDADLVRSRFPGSATCLAIYSRVVNSEAPLHDVLATTFPWCAAWEEALKALFNDYVAAKQSQQVLDYDDLLLYWAGMMGEPALAAEVGARFDHVLVDEYQDTNRLQATILRGLKPDGAGVTVVGDDAQAIYGFRAATVRNILDFPSQYDPPAQVVTLERNYRSTQPILDASNAVIALAAERFAKHLATDRRPHVEPQRAARARARAPQHPLREVRRPQVPRGSARQGCAGAAALGRESQGAPVRLSRGTAAGGGRPGGCDAIARCDGRRRRSARRDAPPSHACRGARGLDGVAGGVRDASQRRSRLAGGDGRRARVVRAADVAPLRGRRDSRGRSRAAAPHRGHLREPRALSHRADA
jgi:hypothetical protein